MPALSGTPNRVSRCAAPRNITTSLHVGRARSSLAARSSPFWWQKAGGPLQTPVPTFETISLAISSELSRVSDSGIAQIRIE